MGYDLLKPQKVIMVVPDSVKEKVGELPDISGMSKDDLSALVKQLYDQSCAVFGEKFHMEYAVKKRDMEIHNLEMETSESHGTFKIPKLKKVNKFKNGRRGREINYFVSFYSFCPTTMTHNLRSSSSHPLEHLIS